MAHNTLLQPQDIKEHIGIMSSMAACELRHIRKVELLQFRECLGKAFYDYLKDHLTDVSKCTNWCEYDDQGEPKYYQEGDIVVYDGILYVACKTTKAIPVVEGEWKLVQKFTKDCLNELWCDYLCEYLAWEVFKNRAPYLGIRIGPDGYIKSTGRDFVPADYKDKEFLSRTIDRDVCIAWDNLEDFLKENESGCFDLFKGNAKGSCGSCGCLDKKCTCQKDCGDAKRTKYKRRIG